jgi:hypothetical protein
LYNKINLLANTLSSSHFRFRFQRFTSINHIRFAHSWVDKKNLLPRHWLLAYVTKISLLKRKKAELSLKVS